MKKFKIEHNDDHINIRLPFKSKFIKGLSIAVLAYYAIGLLFAAVFMVFFWRAWTGFDADMDARNALRERQYEESRDMYDEFSARIHNVDREGYADTRCENEMKRLADHEWGGKLMHNCRVNPDTGLPYTDNEMIAKWYRDPVYLDETGDETVLDYALIEYPPNFGKTIADGDEKYIQQAQLYSAEEICKVQLDIRGVKDGIGKMNYCHVNPDTEEYFTPQEMMDKWYVSFEENPYRFTGNAIIQPKVGFASGEEREAYMLAIREGREPPQPSNEMKRRRTSWNSTASIDDWKQRATAGNKIAQKLELQAKIDQRKKERAERDAALRNKQQ